MKKFLLNPRLVILEDDFVLVQQDDCSFGKLVIKAMNAIFFLQSEKNKGRREHHIVSDRFRLSLVAPGPICQSRWMFLQISAHHRKPF